MMPRIAFLVGAVAVVACAGGNEPGPWQQETGYRWRDLRVQQGAPGFTDMAERGGVDFANAVSDSVLVGNRVLGQGAGVALGDVDGDGRPDVFLAKTQGCNALYRNLGGWRFEDITERAGVGACDRYSTGATLADVEGDGDLDLILLATTGPNAIYLNDGSGAFTERQDLGLDPTGRGGTTIAMADADGDGRLDLYVANYKAWNIDDSIPPQRRAMNQMIRQTGPGRYEVVPEHRANYKVVMRPDMGGLRMTTRAEPDHFYRNVDGRFERVPLTSGRFLDTNGRPVTEEPESFTLDARFADLTGDGAPDLYVANDFEDTDELWYNDGRGNFRRADWRSVRQMSHSSMGVDVGDVNNDGRLDVFTTDMLAKDSRRLKTQIPTHTALPKRPGQDTMQLQHQRNTLLVNQGDGFSEVGFVAGVEASGWSWGTIFNDVDLDGWPDILIANGHLWDIMDADTHERISLRLTEVHWQRLRWEFPKLPLRNVAFRNRGDMTFEDASQQWGFGRDEDISHALAAADLDGDGDLDVVVNRLDARAQLLRNNVAARRIAVRLVGDAPNTRAVGARVRLLGGAVPSQEREVAAGGLYMSHSDYELSFAMGEADSATLVVDWRDGRRTTISSVRPNRLYEITTAAPGTAPARGPVQLAGESATTRTLFADATPALGGHTHIDSAFNDWERQLLLPTALSQLGPGVSWFDHDRDGDEDLFIGAGRGGRLGVFRNEGGRLSAMRGQGPVATADFTSVLGLATGNSARLLLGVSSWESAGTAAVVSVAAGASVSTTAAPLLPPSDASTGPMALGDYTGDGVPDLFVGGRALPGRYPQAAPSRLYRNVNGTFTMDSANSVTLAAIDMASGAVFADMDADGDADLLVARDWDSILLLINDAGTLRAAPASMGLARWTSRWNGIATGDLDGDGRLDIVASSWGRNIHVSADSARPLVMFHGPFGAAGQEEMVLAQHDARINALAPMASYARVRIVFNDLPGRVSSFAQYGDASAEQVIGPAMSKATRREIVTLDHMAFLNRGDRFEPVALPAEAQLAPGFHVAVADFTGDGFEDVFLSQNFFATAVGVPRYDAGRALLLTGDGTGGLRAMRADASGIALYGEQRGAAYADYDADGRLDLVVTQNASTTRLLRNQRARPGLRVRVRGPSSNPDGIGVQLRLVTSGQAGGPVREIQSGSGYWSQNGAVQVFGLSGTPTAVRARWPGGAVTETPVPAGAREVVIRAPR